MSFRNRLTSFFVVIVLLPMVGVGVLVFRLISDSGQAKAAARANGLAAAAASVYLSDQVGASSAAAGVARAAAGVPASELPARLRVVATQAGLVRIVLTRGHRTILDLGDPTAVAPGTATFIQGGRSTRVSVSTVTARQFVSGLELSGGVVVSQGTRILASSIPTAAARRVPRAGSVTLGGSGYEASSTNALPAFGAARLRVTMLSSLRSTSGSLNTSRIVAAVFIVGFLLLAFSFALLASRGLESQLGRFLRAARRLGGGDFSAPVPVEGSDDFAMLAVEFNSMSDQLAQRLEQLRAERARLRESIHRAGETFASNLDRHGLLKLALRTAVDGVEGEFGRMSARSAPDEPLCEVARHHLLDGVGDPVLAAERSALREGGLSEATIDDVHVLAVPLGPVSAAGKASGLVSVGRRGRGFSDDDKDLLRSLVGQATLALDNVELHEKVQLQAVTDELTGLANHGRFQEVLGGEMEQVRRYHYPVGLIMLDLDDFKKINDTYGHQQGDLVLRSVAHVLQQTSREADSAARYGGEEMALILPHTDLEGSYAIAERVRSAIAELRIPRLDGRGQLRVTASLGVGATTEGPKDALIADTDAALYRAKHGGKNQTVRATSVAANVVGGE
jgi:diguanylate cyclase (GGDEF)-like protein